MWRSTSPTAPAAFHVTRTLPFQLSSGGHGAPGGGPPSVGPDGGSCDSAYSVNQSNVPPGARFGMSKLRGFAPSGRNTPNACGTKKPMPGPFAFAPGFVKWRWKRMFPLAGLKLHVTSDGASVVAARAGCAESAARHASASALRCPRRDCFRPNMDASSSKGSLGGASAPPSVEAEREAGGETDTASSPVEPEAVTRCDCGQCKTMPRTPTEAPATRTSAK